MGPHPAVAAIRLGVRRSLACLAPGELALAACSGGADSLALAAALAFEAPRLGLRGGGVTVDHRLQPGSAARAKLVSNIMAELGLDPVRSVAVAGNGSAASAGKGGQVPGSGSRIGSGSVAGRQGHQGPEGAARAVRYAALESVAEATGAAAVLLGHTLDDQAETVLLRLARGSGARSLSGMAARRGCYLRPLLGIRRAQTGAACAALGLRPWDDPHNTDRAYARARVRGDILPLMERLLGPGVAEALARSASQLRADADVLERLADGESGRLAGPGPSLPADELAELPAAIRARVLRSAALAAGCPAGALSARHVSALDELVTGWHGQRAADLPGGVRCQRRCGRLLFSARA